VLATYADYQDFVERLPTYLADITRSLYRRMTEAEVVETQVREVRRQRSTLVRRTPKERRWPAELAWYVDVRLQSPLEAARATAPDSYGVSRGYLTPSGAGHLTPRKTEDARTGQAPGLSTNHGRRRSE
jgi:hypothetical protein